MSPGQADRVRDALLELRRSGEDNGPPARDDELDPLIERLDDAPPDRSIDLTGPPEVLREVTLVAIDEAGNAIGTSCTDLLRGEADSHELRGEVRALDGLLELLASVERSAQP